ncbi:STAS domain-containing protein [Amorphus coralli]|uniref:STAS domain-containing protein n=1 Tax=Amorphus coralli TaxID=340680 RepID=UPI00037A1675|nr:STAS domain-containing protein [Amorphus coralli]
MTALTVTEEEIDGVVVMAPVGRVDSANAKAFETEVLQKIQDGMSRIVLDFDQLEYISSAGLRVVLIAGKKVKATGGVLALCKLGPTIHDVFEISGFISLFPVHDSREDAIAAARG